MNDWEAKKEKARRATMLLNKVRLYLVLHGGTPLRQLDKCQKEKCPHFRGDGSRCRLQGLHANRRLYAVFDAGKKFVGIVPAKKSGQYPHRLCVSGLVPEES